MLLPRLCGAATPPTRVSKYDAVVVGGGIVGTAIAKVLQEALPRSRMALLERDKDLALHQTSHNSNVIHAGLYYLPDSLKARLCVQGSQLIYEYCATNDIPVRKSGKLILAADVLETHRLRVLHRRGVQNRIPGLTLLTTAKEIAEIQPHCKGLQALWCPSTGNVDWAVVARHFAQDFASKGGHIFVNCGVEKIVESTTPSHPVQVDCGPRGTFLAKSAILCLGLHSGTLLDRDQDLKNISLKVNYRKLHPAMTKFIKTNIYAMPHIDMPFIGVHISPMVDGNVLLGPSAVPALKMDGYRWSSVDLNYIQDHVLSRGVGLLFLKNLGTCSTQVLETLCEDARRQVLTKLFPMIGRKDMLEGPSAVQGQVVTGEGEFVDDFVVRVFEGEGVERRLVECRFVPSPGATCALALAHLVTDHVKKVCVESVLEM